MNAAALARPRVTISYAQTLDGRLATRSGSSQWIGGPESLVFAHALRSQHDAIMVGVGTVLIDNPRLTVRHVAGRNPQRVVVDSALRTPLGAAVLSREAHTIIATTERAPAARISDARAHGAEALVLPHDAAGRVDLPALLAALHKFGIASVMVEGGAALITALLRLQLVDRLAICVAPKILGTGIEAIGDLGIDQLAHALQLRELSVQRLGVDTLIEGVVQYAQAEPTHE